MAYSWEEMLEEFRKLGGTADNFVQRQGSRGRGIFPIDNTTPVRLRVPRNLLVPAEDIEFVDDQLRIRNSAAVGAAEREFVEKYENTFSWGGGGRSECAAFLEGMKNLHVGMSAPPFVKSFLDAAKTSVDESVGRRFLHSRCITFEDKSVLMPVMELVNHDPLANGYDVEDDISIEGGFSDEVLVRYSIRDPFGMFLSYGFASPEKEDIATMNAAAVLVIGKIAKDLKEGVEIARAVVKDGTPQKKLSEFIHLCGNKDKLLEAEQKFHIV